MHWFKLVLLVLYAIDAGIRLAMLNGFKPPAATTLGSALAMAFDAAILVCIWQYV